MSICVSQHEDVLRLYNKGYSLAHIGQIYNCAPNTVRRHILLAGGTCRTLSAALKQYELNESVFDDITKSDAQYWVGFILADGCIHEELGVPVKLTIELQKQDEPHLHKFNKFIQTSKPVYQLKRTGGVRVEVRSKQIAAKLGNVGVTPRKSATAKASVYLSQQVDFWRGVVDGDGGMTISNNKPSLYLSGTPHIINQFREFVNNVLHIDTKSTPYTTSPTFSTISYSGYVAVQVSHALYHNSSVCLDRKYAMYIRLREWLIDRYQSVTPKHKYYNKIKNTAEYCGVL